MRLPLPSLVSRIFSFVLLIAASWCVMTFTHESGHLVGGWLSGGELLEFDLLPWHLPHSRFHPDPQPLVTLWAGPVLGVVVPISLAWVIRRNWAFFIADFCLLANGAYIAAGWIAGDTLLDATRLLDQGAHPAMLVLYSLMTIPLGYVRFRRDCVRAFGRPPSGAVDAGSE